MGKVALKEMTGNFLANLKKGIGQPGLAKYFDKIKEMSPQPKPKPIVGLDIGASAVKVVNINNSASGHEIDKFAIEPVNQNDVKAAITAALEKTGITSKVVNTSISGQGVIIRYVQMPKMSYSDIRASISLEADKYFPFPLEDIEMDCVVLEEKPQESKLLVLVAAAKKELIEQRIGLISGLGLEAETIYTDSIAIANIFNVLGSSGSGNAPVPDDKPGALAILNIGGAYTNLNIIKDRIPRFTRDIFVGGIDFTKRISNILGLDLKSAEGLKISPGDEREKVLQACESVLNTLITEVRLSFDYFETENNIPVKLLYLSGGGSCLAGLEEILTQNLGVGAKVWQPFAGLSVNPSLSRQDLACQANKLSVAIGLALR